MDKKIDLVLVNPSARARVYQKLGENLAAVEPPVWAGMMASFAKKQGYSMVIVDAEAEQLSPEEIAERVADCNARLAVVVVYGHQPSASTQNMIGAGMACTAIKARKGDQNILLVGGHVASLPKRTLQEENADFTCSGEGLFTIVGLIEALKSSEPRFENVPDLWYWDGDQIKSTKPAPLVTDLDQQMPGLAWELLPMERYRAHNWHCFGHLERQPYAAIYTTLGCPFHCAFCCIQAPFKSGEKTAGFAEKINTYRLWSTEVVMAQIDLLVNKYGVRNLKIADEMFVLNPRHVLGLCDRIIERGYDLNIWAYARVDSVKENMVETLRRAGVRWLAFGIEAASEKVRQDVDKGFSQEMIARTLKRVRDAGINVIGNYIFGLPEDNYDSMKATLDLAMDLNCEFGNFYCAMAYPGSRLYDLAIQKAWPLPETWAGYSQHSRETLPLPTRYLTASEVLRFRDEAFQTYFQDPRFLEMVGSRFGANTVQHIREMSAHKLERKILAEPTSQLLK